MKTKILILALCFLVTAAFGQIQNYDFTTTNVVSGVTIVGDSPLVAFQKTSNNVAFLQAEHTNDACLIATNAAQIAAQAASISALQSVSPITNASATAASISAGSAPQFSLVITNGGIVGYIGIPYQAPYTNAVFPTPVYTLLDTNPILFNGSNYLGNFTNVYTVTINVPSTSVGTSVGTNIVENLYASYTGTNGWFAVTNFPCNFWNTNVYLSVVGDGTNVTLNTGEVIVQSMLNYQYAGVVYDLTGTPVLVANSATNTQAVNYNTMVNYVGNYAGYSWVSIPNGIAYSPFGSNIMSVAHGSVTGSTNLSFTFASTNWILSVKSTNFAAGSGLYASVNLMNTNGWFLFSPSLYTLTTNSGVISYTIPKVNTSVNYEFFRLAAYTTPSITAYAPIICASNSWANAIALATNNLTPGQTAFFVSSNGVGVYRVQNSAGTFIISPQ